MLCNEKTMLRLISNHTGIWVIFLFYGLSSCHTKNWGECFLEKYKKSLQSRFVLFLFHALEVPSWNIRSSLSFRFESSISWNIRIFLRAVFFFFFFFLGSEIYFLKYKKNMRLESSISGYIRHFFAVEFFHFFELGPKVVQVAL